MVTTFPFIYASHVYSPKWVSLRVTARGSRTHSFGSGSKRRTWHSVGAHSLLYRMMGSCCLLGVSELNCQGQTQGPILVVPFSSPYLCLTAFAVILHSLAEQFVEKSSCAQPLGELSSLDAHAEFGGSGGGSSPSSSSLCTEPLIPTTPIIPSEEMAKIACSLETKELWDKFHELGTEMIITKSGR